MKYRKTICYESYLVVFGWGSEAYDMLRYDNCMPATEAEAGNMKRGTCPVILRRRALTNNRATAERWRSFGCRLLGEFGTYEEAEEACGAYEKL